jgi:hypothetical protein
LSISLSLSLSVVQFAFTRTTNFAASQPSNSDSRYRLIRLSTSLHIVCITSFVWNYVSESVVICVLSTIYFSLVALLLLLIIANLTQMTFYRLFPSNTPTSLTYSQIAIKIILRSITATNFPTIQQCFLHHNCPDNLFFVTLSYLNTFVVISQLSQTFPQLSSVIRLCLSPSPNPVRLHLSTLPSYIFCATCPMQSSIIFNYLQLFPLALSSTLLHSRLTGALEVITTYKALTPVQCCILQFQHILPQSLSHPLLSSL